MGIWLGCMLALAPEPPTITAPRIDPSITRTDDDDDEARDMLQAYERLPGGGLRYVDPQRRFTATISPDGRVRFSRARTSSLSKPKLIKWFDELADAVHRPRGQRGREETDGTPPLWATKARADAAMITVHDGGYGPPPILVGIGGQFGGAAMVATSRSAQADFLRATESMRESMRVRARDAAWDKAERRMTDQVVETLRDSTRPAAERRREVFELWDELAPDPSADLSAEDATRRDRAIEIQRRIERLVRALAPAGSTTAFTDAELDALNDSRKSTRRFDPYRQPPPTPEAADPMRAPSTDAPPRLVLAF